MEPKSEIILKFKAVFILFILIGASNNSFSQCGPVAKYLKHTSPSLLKDAFIHQGQPNQNWGSSANLLQGKNSNGKMVACMFKFDLSKIPNNAKIANAFLKPHINNSANSNHPTNGTVYNIAASWNESNVTWNIPVSFYGNPGRGDPATSFSSSSSQNILDGGIRVKDHVKDMRNNNYNYGFLLWAKKSSTNKYVFIQSQEHNKISPNLGVSYCVPSSKPSGIFASSNSICSGKSVNLSINGGDKGSGEWIWYKGGCGSTKVGSGSNISVSPNSTTTYYVRAENSSPCNCTNCVSKTINVTPSPSKPSICGLSKSTYCDGESETVSVCSPQSGVNYSWSCNGAASCSGSGSSTTVDFNGSGNATIKVSGENNCDKRSESKVVNVINCNKSIAGFYASPKKGTSPLTVKFYDQSQNTPKSWTWNFGDDNTSNQKNPAHTYYNKGCYTVTLTVSNSSGSNSKTKSRYINVDGGCSSGIENTSTLNSFQLVPNPNQGKFTIRIDNTKQLKEMQIIVLNTLGQVIYNELLNVDSVQFKKKIPLNKSKPGIYFVHLETNEGIMVKKVIIE